MQGIICCAYVLGCVRFFATPWTIARQAPLSTGLSRQEYWSGLPFRPAADLPNPGIEPRYPTLQVDSLPSKPSGKPKNTGVGSCSLFQRIFPTQGSSLNLPHCRQILYHLSHQGSPGMANGHVKGCSASLIVREMQIRTTVKYHFTLVSMAITEKSTDNK